MKYLLVIICSLFCSGVFSQTEQFRQARKMSFGIYFSPTINYRTLISGASNDLVKTIRNDEEVAGLGYRAGITFDYRIAKKIELQSGLILSNRVFETSKQSLNWPDENISTITEAFISHQYMYLDIPLKLKYNFFPKKRLNWFVAGGVNTALFFLYNKKNHVKVSGDWEVSKDQSFHAHPINFLAEIESGIEYRLSKNFRVRTALNFQHALLPTNSNLKTKEFLYSSGLSLGLVFTPYK